MSITTSLTFQIESLMADFDRASAEHEQRVAYMPQDRRAEALATGRANLAAQYRQRLDGLAVALWGWPSGAAWAEPEAAEARLRQAKTDAADKMPWGRVQAELGRLRQVVSSAVNLAELEQWYDGQADTTERFTLAYSADAVRARFGNSGQGVGSFLKRLELDRNAATRTPGVEKAEAELQARLDERIPAFLALKNSLGRAGVGDGLGLAEAQSLYRQIAPNVQVEPQSGQMIYRFEHVLEPALGVGEPV